MLGAPALEGRQGLGPGCEPFSSLLGPQACCLLLRDRLMEDVFQVPASTMKCRTVPRAGGGEALCPLAPLSGWGVSCSSLFPV